MILIIPWLTWAQASIPPVVRARPLARSWLVGASPKKNDGGSGGVLEGEIENGAQISVIC